MRLVPVTQRHIDEGIRGDATACPVAFAMNDAGLYPMSVQPSEINFGDEYDPETHYTSARLAEWMYEFDDGNPVEPVTVVVVGPDGVLTVPEYQSELRCE